MKMIGRLISHLGTRILVLIIGKRPIVANVRIDRTGVTVSGRNALILGCDIDGAGADGKACMRIFAP